MEDRSSDIILLNGNNFSPLYINLVIFGQLIAEFTRVEILNFETEKASISSGVSLATFARRQHCYALRRSVLNIFHYYSLGGDTAIPCGLHTRLCYAFLVIGSKSLHLNYFEASRGVAVIGPQT